MCQIQEFQQDLPKIMKAMDQPTIDGINTWFVAKAAKKQGLKVAISGLGGDELFGGYPSFRDIPRWVKLLGLPSHIPGLGILAGKTLTAFKPLFSRINPKAAGMIRYGSDYAGAYLLKRGLFLPNELKQVIDSDLVEEGLRRLRPQRFINQVINPSPASSFGKVAALESSLYMCNQLLRDTDWAGMAHSLEVRVPLVDAWLLRQIAKQPAPPKNTTPKELLAKSPSNPLPEFIVKRAKSGFTMPISKWQQRMRDTQKWCSRPLLKQQNCPWARRWAYSVMVNEFI